MGQIEDLRNRSAAILPAAKDADDDLRASLAIAQAEIVKMRLERDAAVRELATRPASKGLGLNGYFDGPAMSRGDSTESDVDFVDARRSPLPTSPLVAPMALPPIATAVPNRMAHSSSSGGTSKPPPPTPPPTIPPPPLPTSSEQLVTSPTSAAPAVPLKNGARASAGSTRSSQQHDNVGPNTVRNSNASVASELTVDSRVQRKLEEQEQAVRLSIFASVGVALNAAQRLSSLTSSSITASQICAPTSTWSRRWKAPSTTASATFAKLDCR